METLEILYIVLIIFTTVIGSLLTIVLLKLIKVLNTLTEIVDLYNKVKMIISYYEAIPGIVLETIKGYFFGKK